VSLLSVLNLTLASEVKSCIFVSTLYVKSETSKYPFILRSLAGTDLELIQTTTSYSSIRYEVDDAGSESISLKTF
jgi:hypothetical protein